MLPKIIFTFAISATLILTACGNSAATAPANGRLQVIATYSILGDIVQNVGGDTIGLRTLVGPNGDPHTFQPSPADSAALADSALIFENGLGFEPWLDELYTASGSSAPRMVVTAGLTLQKMIGAEPAEAGDGFDPHVWHSVANVITLTKSIRDALVRADPTHAAIYNAQADTYLAQLQELDTWILEQVQTLPKDKRKLVTSHDTFGYFAERYGFEIVGTALASASTESAGPSAAEIAALVEEIKIAGVPALFAENTSNPKLMAQIASEAGVALAPSLYTDALGEPGSAGDTYLKMMRYNVTTLVTALNQ